MSGMCHTQMCHCGVAAQTYELPGAFANGLRRDQSARPPTSCHHVRFYIRVCLCPLEKTEKRDRISRQTRAGIGHSAPAHRGGHLQNRSRRREQRRGRYRTEPQAAEPRVDGRPSRKAEDANVRTEAAGCAPQTTHPARMPRQEQHSASSCAKGVGIPVQQ